ncbi:MAG: molybdopterin-guanine dinucleotide biosynthesis protein B, partial [Deltaproteobacteria bacterium]|nr:molybdopterin-guanine dinucleotide biosynthesis protein B [Deltaproteobacteria bacterium]
MRSFEELLKYSSSIHGHLCAGQVLGVRMAMAGCREVGIEEPRGSKKLVVFVEIDRCATDAIQAVTGCSLGKRTLKFCDYGKMAATFVNLETQKAVRVLARDEARLTVAASANGCSSEQGAQKEAYAVMPEEALFEIQPVRVQIPDEDMPGARGGRQICARCGEGINSRRALETNGETLCVPCARGGYLAISREKKAPASVPKTELILGTKKSGKTALIEKLVPELSARGYRVGTVKHHHSSSPLDVDRAGKDSWKHRQAGARAVALVSPTEVALFQDTYEPTPLDEIIKMLKNLDLVLVEGFRAEAKPRIEVGKFSAPPSLTDAAGHLLAVVSS